MAVDTITYTPPNSVAGYLTSSSFISLIVGPVGSTKTTASIMKIAYHAAKMAKCKDGIRRSKCVVIRNTREMLRDTTIPDFLRWFPDGPAGVYAKTEYKFYLKFSDVECEVLFRGLDDANDVRRLLSLQVSFGMMDEFREINPLIFDALQGRLGRYPSKLDNGVGCVTDTGESNAHLWGASNPPDQDTTWEQFLTNPPDNTAAFFQPSGLAPEADWTQYLPDDYYANLAKGKTEEWIDVYIHSKFGKTLAGRAVHTAFDSKFHTSPTPLRPLRMGRPLMIGFDFGLNPSVVIGQLDPMGRLLIFDAMTSDGMGLTRFIATRLKPKLTEPKYLGMPVIVIGDPAGQTRAQTDERTCFDILKAAGFKVIAAKTNATVARVAAVDAFLTRQVEGKAGFLLDPENTLPLARALRGGYRYRLKKTGEHEDSPEKNEHSHIADASQYLCLHAEGDLTGAVSSLARREVKRVASGGWT